ncbi:MAG: putative synthase protein [Nocardioides sp.]|jgi:ATP synthase protein I|nr:putative synthase protein [Nocardioides sp.]
MMTTEAPRPPQVDRDSGVSVLVGAAVAALVLGLVMSLVGAFAAGSAAALGALVGTALVVVVLAGSSLVVNLVAGMMPTAALMFALLTYTMQVVLMGLVFAALSASGLLDSTLDRSWLAAAVIGGVAIWLVSQVLLVTRRRIPVFDLPSEAGER